MKLIYLYFEPNSCNISFYIGVIENNRKLITINWIILKWYVSLINWGIFQDKIHLHSLINWGIFRNKIYLWCRTRIVLFWFLFTQGTFQSLAAKVLYSVDSWIFSSLLSVAGLKILITSKVAESGELCWPLNVINHKAQLSVMLKMLHNAMGYGICIIFVLIGLVGHCSKRIVSAVANSRCHWRLLIIISHSHSPGPCILIRTAFISFLQTCERSLLAAG